MCDNAVWSFGSCGWYRMLENNNLKICRRLVRREFQFHKGRSILLIAAIALVSMLCTFSFSLGFMTHDGLVYSYQVHYGSTCHIVYEGLNASQAEAVASRPEVKEAVYINAVGILSDEVMEYRKVKLAPVSDGWARAAEAAPVCGRMPKKDDEIAMDELTMRSLAIPPKEGAKVTLRFIPSDGGEERVDTFRLCGWWSSDMGASDTCAWITPGAADRLCPAGQRSVTLGVILYHPEDLERRARELLQSSGADGVTYTTSLACNDARRKRAASQAVPYYRITIVVALCGILMIYNIVRISAEQNVRFYGRVKSLGMTPRQIIRFLSWQALYLCLPAVPAGWALGFMLHRAAAPYIIQGMGGSNPAFRFFSLWPFVCSAFLTFGTTMAACALPARFVHKISPAQALHYSGVKPKKEGRKRRHPGEIGRIKLPAMALSGILRDKGRIVLAVCSLFLSLTWLCILGTQYASTDEEKYMKEIAHSDYLIADASAAVGLQRYNPESRSITPGWMERLAGHKAVTDLGVIRTMEVPMYADEKERACIVESFEGRNEDGIVRKEVMADSPDWGRAYETFRETGEYIGIATGVDGLALSVLLKEGEYVKGAYDEARFASGDYVIAAGASSASFISTPPVGSSVEIGGRTFTILSSVAYKTHIVTGSDSREAAFNVSYYMPESVYEELYPESGIRNVLVDIDEAYQTEFEIFLNEITADTGIGITMRSKLQWEFQNALFHNYMIPMFVGAVLLLIGIVNFINALITGMLSRRKEFAVYESLGMAPSQLRSLVIWEGMFYLGALVLVLVPGVSGITWLVGRWWASASSSAWCVTWRYSLTPLFVALPVIGASTFAVLLCCLRIIRQESVTQRLRVM